VRSATVLLDGTGATVLAESQLAAGGNLATPSGIALHPKGGVIVAEPASSSLVRIASDGAQSIVASGNNLVAPTGVANLPGRVPSGAPVGFTPTLSGQGYWIVTTTSQAYHFGNAPDPGELSHLALFY
jgi:hypothetical protein